MSLKKIASELGISSTTVSRALNGYDDVAPATRERIREAAKRLGYQPNSMARRLKMGKTDAVALAYPSRPRVLNNSTFLEMIGWISIELAKFGIDLLLIPDDPNETYHSLIRLVETRRVDALLVAHTKPDDRRLKYLQEQNFPFLALGRSNLPQPYAWFDFDNHAGSVMAVERLVKLGHRHIAFLSTDAPLAYVEQRLQGYSDALAHCSLPPIEHYIQKSEPNRPGGYNATRRLLALDTPPTAIITDCNMLGEGAAGALQQAGCLGKQGVSLIVYDGLPDDNLIDVAVTPIVQNTRTNVGKQIAGMIRRLLDGCEPQQVQELWQPALGQGDTDCPPR